MRSIYRPLLAHRVVVVMRDERTFTGTAIRALPDLLVLARAELLPERGAPQVLDGELVLDRSAIAFIQVQGARWP